jgi:hypothetical protein
MPKKKTTEETNPTLPDAAEVPAQPVPAVPPSVFGKSHPLMSVIVDVTDEAGEVIRTESYIVSAQLKMKLPDRAADQPSLLSDVQNYVGSMFTQIAGGPSLDVEARLVRSMKAGTQAPTMISLEAARRAESPPASPSGKKGSGGPVFHKLPKPKYEPPTKEPK